MAQIPGVTTLLFPRAVVNAFLVQADVLTLIDTGTPGAAAKVVSAVRAAGGQPGDIGRIVVTHRHADHAANAAELAKLTGADVHISPQDAPYLRDGREQPKPRAATPLGRLMVPYVKVALPWKLTPTPVLETLVEGAMIGPFQIVETPGHTAGHVSVLWVERGVLFTGDAAAHITGLGPHPAADDPERARASFRRLGELEFSVACFGHGRPITSQASAAFRAAS